MVVELSQVGGFLHIEVVKQVGIEASRDENEIWLEEVETREHFSGKGFSPHVRGHEAGFERQIQDAAREVR